MAEQPTVQQKLLWLDKVAEQFAKLRLGHEGFMLDKIQRGSRLAEQLAIQSANGSSYQLTDPGEGEDMGVNIGDVINYTAAPAPTPPPPVKGTSTLAKVLTGAALAFGGVGAGFGVSQLLQPSGPAVVDTDTDTDTHSDIGVRSE